MMTWLPVEKECMDTERPLNPELEAMIERMLTTQK